MSLFDTRGSESALGPKGSEEGVRVSDAPYDFINAASLKYFKHYLADVVPGKHYHFWTGGQWNMHELLQYLLTITGPAKVWVTTWSISQDGIRALWNLKEKNILTEVNCVFDYKVKEHKGEHYLLAKNCFNVVLRRIHAKVMVIENATWCMVVTGSANWTRNPRIERQLLCTVPEVARADRMLIDALLRGENPFKVR